MAKNTMVRFYEFPSDEEALAAILAFWKAVATSINDLGWYERHLENDRVQWLEQMSHGAFRSNSEHELNGTRTVWIAQYGHYREFTPDELALIESIPAFATRLKDPALHDWY